MRNEAFHWQGNSGMPESNTEMELLLQLRVKVMASNEKPNWCHNLIATGLLMSFDEAGTLTHQFENQQN